MLVRVSKELDMVLPKAEVWEEAVDRTLPSQFLRQGLFFLWWTGEDGGRAGMLGEVRLCPMPDCPLREAEIHVVLVGDQTERLHQDAVGRVHAEGPGGTVDISAAPQAVAAVTFEAEGRRVGFSDGDPALQRRLRAALKQGPLFAFVEAYWEHERGGRLDGWHQHPEPGRNDPCPCGSGRKYKKCCLPRGGEIQALTSEQAAELRADMVAAASRGLFPGC